MRCDEEDGGSVQGTARRAEHGSWVLLLLSALNARASCYDDGQPRVERAVGDDARGSFHADQRVSSFNQRLTNFGHRALPGR